MGTGIVTILGCGGSGGVPLIGNHWGVCDSNNPKNRRTRSSIHVQIEDASIVIDTGPDFYNQINREDLDKVDCVLYTHAHGDHVNGIDDLRVMSLMLKEIIPVYGAKETIEEIATRYAYLFELKNPLYQPRMSANIFKEEDIGGIIEIAFEKTEMRNICCFDVMPFAQKHGEIRSLGYRFGDFAYSTDVSEFSQNSLKHLKGVKTWLLDCGQYGQDFILVHPNFKKVLEWNAVVGAERVILTHLNIKADYKELCDNLPKGYEPAYDGMKIDFDF